MISSIQIAEKKYCIEGDEGYLKHAGTEFEPETIALLSFFCKKDSQILDIGANIGLTALAFANMCPNGKIIAIEPVKRTFEYLKRNIDHSGFNNISIYNFAVGKTEGNVLMYAADTFLAGAFVGDHFAISHAGSFSEKTRLRILDNTFNEFNLDHIDFVKLDVEGYELSVLEGMHQLINKFKPIVMLEMNHFCLNVFQKIPLPEFRDKLLSIFPYVFAIEKEKYLDFSIESEFYEIAYSHILKFNFLNVIAGFDKDKIIESLNLNSLYYNNKEKEREKEKEIEKEKEREREKEKPESSSIKKIVFQLTPPFATHLYRKYIKNFFEQKT